MCIYIYIYIYIYVALEAVVVHDARVPREVEAYHISLYLSRSLSLSLYISLSLSIYIYINNPHLELINPSH